MTAACDRSVSDDRLIEYWSRELPPAESDEVEEHLFACAECAARLDHIASLGIGVSRLARAGRISGIISRTLLNRLQREGVRVRVFSLAPGETVPCTAFPDDDLVVISLRGDFTGVDAVTVSVSGLPDVGTAALDEVPVSTLEGEVLWATPGAAVRRIPSSLVTLTLTTGSGRQLGTYVLDHSVHADGEH